MNSVTVQDADSAQNAETSLPQSEGNDYESKSTETQVCVSKCKKKKILA